MVKRLFGNEHARFLICSIFASFVACLIFSAFVKGLYLVEPAVNIGRTVIKILSVLIGSIYAVKDPKHGLVKGVIWGASYSLMSFLLFSLLSGGVDFSVFSVSDVLFCMLIGAICGIIAVNVKK